MAGQQSDSDDFAWIGTVGDWQTPAVWDDLTTGTDPSALAPGAGSTVTFDATAVVDGFGTSSVASIAAVTSLLGTFAIDVVSFDGGNLTLGPGATLDSSLLDTTAAGTITVGGAGATLRSDQDFRAANSLALAVGGGGTVVLPGITLAQGGTLLSTGSGSVLEGGTFAEDGYVVVEVSSSATTVLPGLSLSVGGSIILADTLSSLEASTTGFAGPGTLLLDNRNETPFLGTETSGLALVQAPVIDVASEVYVNAIFNGTVTGDGTFDLPSGSAIIITGNVDAGSALTFLERTGSDLISLPAFLPAATTIALAGSNSALDFAGTAAAATFDVQALITGFAAGDRIVVDTTDPVTQASYDAAAAGPGTLVLGDATGQTVGTLALEGIAAGTSFLVTSLPGDVGSVEIDVAGAITTTPVARTTQGYQWVGPSGGAWDQIANWRGTTTGSYPTPISSATIDSDLTTFDPSALVITGPGAVGTLTTIGRILLDGDFSIGTIPSLSGTLDIAPGETLAIATIDLASVAEQPGTDGPATLMAYGRDALLTVGTLMLISSDYADDGATNTTGTTPAPAVVATATGGRVVIGGNIEFYAGNSLNVGDTASAIEVGNAGTGGAGALTIDAGSTIYEDFSDDNPLRGSNQVYGPGALSAPTIVDNGMIIARDITLNGAVTGGGTLLTDGTPGIGGPAQVPPESGVAVVTGAIAGTLSLVVGQMGTMFLSDTIAATDSITFTGSNALVSFLDIGSFDVAAPISGFVTTDTIEVVGTDAIASARFVPTSTDGGTLVLQDADGGTIGDLLLDGSYTGDLFSVQVMAGGTIGSVVSDITLPAPCFVSGTRLATPAGAAAVQTLAVGQHVLTDGGAAREIRWIGHRQVDCARHPDPAQVWPVRVAADAFGPEQPQRDLYLSPDHAVYAEGVLVPIRVLVNGTTVQAVPVRFVEYWHVELDSHDLVLAEGLAVESYLDTGNRHAFGGSRTVSLHPDFGTGVAASMVWAALGRAPLRIDGPEVARLRARLASQAMPASAVRIAPTTDLAALLDPRWYLATYPDVAGAGLAAAAHYRGWGHGEGRLPCPPAVLLRGLGMVDQDMHAFGLADLVTAGVDPATHYCAHGWREGRRLNFYFDAAWYSATHDVEPDKNPLLHYLLRGELRGLPPGPHFDPAWYRSTYGLAPTQSPLAHYLLHRHSWRVRPNRRFDLAGFVHRPGSPPQHDPYLHGLTVSAAVQWAA